MFFKIRVPKNFVIFTGKHFCWSHFLIKLEACNLIKKRPQHRCFPLSVTKFLRTAFCCRAPLTAASAEAYLRPCQSSMIGPFAKSMAIFFT